jgi:uncharacterized repeat protein (TIGR03837 family)
VDIVLLCKVVDNFGDIGVVYRLARSLSELLDPPSLRLVVDNLEAFRALEPAVDVGADYQRVRGWEVFRWRETEAAEKAFRDKPPRVVVECFACGRPDWLEALLFEAPLFDEPAAPGATDSLLIDLEYLTAEAYAEEFHRMPSLTRSATVRKAMFLPGFTAKTGGLILDRSFMAARSRAASRERRAELRRELLSGLEAGLVPTVATSAQTLPSDVAERFWACVFTYERDYSSIVADLAAFAKGRTVGGRPCSAPRPILVLSAAGKSQACFRSAWDAAGRPFPLLELPFLPQETWDRFLLASDFSIVRGEDSWSRAALAGKPFLWQAYPQAERYQMVKVEAFLERLRPHFDASVFAPLAAAYRALNDRDRDTPATIGDESVLPLLEASPSLASGFRDFADSILGIGNLAENLVATLKRTGSVDRPE